VIFLIDYDRAVGRLVSMTVYPNDRLLDAQNAALELELKHRPASIEREVVLLEAADELALRRTHGRYFEDLSQLAEAPK
jgi:hypothetical protein